VHELVRHGFFLLVVTLVTLTFGLLVRDLLLSCFWAVVLAILFQSVHQHIRAWLPGHEDWAALACTVVIVLVVMVPLAIAAQALAMEGWELSSKISDGSLDPNRALELLEQRFPAIQEWAANWQILRGDVRSQLREGALQGAQVIAVLGWGYAQGFLSLLVLAALSVYLLFYFLRDGQLLPQAIGAALPLGKRAQTLLFGRFVRAIRASVKGIAIVAAVQGAMGALLFWLLGLPAPFLAGTAMGLLSVVPFGGSGFVWFPAAIILLLAGEIARPLVLMGVGFFIIMSVDNLLRPRLVGSDLGIPDFLVLLSTFGGLAWFGLSGFLLGPVLASIFLACWQLMARQYGRDAQNLPDSSLSTPDEARSCRLPPGEPAP